MYPKQRETRFLKRRTVTENARVSAISKVFLQISSRSWF